MQVENKVSFKGIKTKTYKYWNKVRSSDLIYRKLNKNHRKYFLKHRVKFRHNKTFPI